jgi:glycosyltransferase involved in cell wall biosynthesis
MAAVTVTTSDSSNGATPVHGVERDSHVGAQRLRVLFLTAYPAIGGPLPKLAPLMVDGLRRRGCEVLVEGWSAHTAGREALAPKVLGRLMDLFRVHARIRTWSPDVVYVATSHNWPALMRDVPIALSVPRRGPPVVLHLHGSECGKLGQRGHGVFTAISTWLMRRAAAVLLLSNEEREVWERFCPRVRFEVVLNPYSPPPRGDGDAARVSRSGSPSQPLILLFIGRLVRDKGILDLLDAFSILRRQRPCRLMIAGVGPAQDDVNRRIALLGLARDVAMLGYVTGDALDRVYRSADVFVLPSYREGFPLSVMEAMGYGLPVVTTPIRGCVDHLVPKVNALFAPPRDPEALAELLLQLLDDDELRRRMGAANLAKAAEFAPDAVIPRYNQILRSVVSDRRGPKR